MPFSTPNPRFVVFVFVLLILKVGLTSFLLMSRDAAFKRKVYPPLAIAGSVIYLLFGWAMGTDPRTLLLIAPFVAVSTYMGLRKVRFCDGCGSTIWSEERFSPPQYCSECGAKLE